MTEAQFKTGFLKSKDQTQLFYRYYPVKNKKASVLLVHGFGEHSGRYSHVVDHLKKEAYEVFCIDFRGHGHSKGKRGDVEKFNLYEEDVIAGINHIENNISQGEKLFLLAHSMGALVSLRALTTIRLNLGGVVLSSPLFNLKIPVPTWKKLASFAVARVAPQLRVGTGIKGRHLSSDERVAKAYDNDPLVLKSLSVRAFREIFNGYQNANALASTITSSMLLQVAGSDPVVDANSSEQWFKHIDKKHRDASLKIYPGFLHEIYNESRRIEPINDVISWLNKRA